MIILRSCLLLLLLALPAFCFAENCTNNLDQHVNIHTLDLSGSSCTLSDEDIPAIMAYLQSHPNVTDLSLAKRYYLKDVTLSWLINNTRLKSLDLSGIDIDHLTMAALANNSLLSYLDLSNDHIDDRSATSLSRMTGLNTLILDGNPITDDTIFALAGKLSITELSLADTEIHEIGILYLTAYFKLKYLNLRDTKGLSIESVSALANDTTLETLDLTNTGVYDQLAEPLSHASTLKVLRLEYNHIGDAGGMAIANNLIVNDLYLSSDEMSKETIEAIKANKNIKHLHLM